MKTQITMTNKATTATATSTPIQTKVQNVTNNEVDKEMRGILKVTKKMSKSNITYSVSTSSNNDYRSHNFTGTLINLKNYHTRDGKRHSSDGQLYDELLCTIDCATTLIINDKQVGDYVVKECERIFNDRITEGNNYPTILFNFTCQQLNVKPTNIIISNVTALDIDSDTVLGDDANTVDNALDQLLSNKTKSGSSATVDAALSGMTANTSKSERQGILSTIVGNFRKYF